MTKEKILKVLRYVFFGYIVGTDDNPYLTPPTEEECKSVGDMLITELYQNSDIEELEQEPCEDCISREQAIKELGEEPYVWTDSDFEIQQLSDWKQHKEMLENLPSVKPKQGHWIYTLEDWNKWECSECGYTKRTDIHVSLGYNYCPNCGVKME